MLDALGFVQKPVQCLRLPPGVHVAQPVKLAALCVEAMRNLVSNDEADGTVVQIGRSVGRKETPLQNAGRKDCTNAMYDLYIVNECKFQISLLMLFSVGRYNAFSVATFACFTQSVLFTGRRSCTNSYSASKRFTRNTDSKYLSASTSRFR